MQPADDSMALTASWSRRAATLILCLMTARVTCADDAIPTPENADGTTARTTTMTSSTTPCQRRGSDCSYTFCEGNLDYLRYQDCDRGTCACHYPLAADDYCYSSPCLGATDCKLCSTTATYASMSDLIPLALTIGVCFVVAVTAMLACKMLIKRMYSGGPVARFGDGDADSVSSMQRWINERLRDRPPRYEEMVSESAPTPATRSSRSARTAPTPDGAPPTISAAVAEAEEKPPAYEVAVNDTQQTAGIYYQGPVADNIPPPVYSAEAVDALATDGRQCYRNPCFLGDVEDPPPYSQSPQRNTRSVSLPDPFVESLFDPFEPPPESAECRASDSSFAASSPSASTATLATASTPPSSPTTSLASFASASSSSFPPTPGEPATAGLDLLTVSQAVALKEMLLAEGVPAATGSVESAVLWTSTC